jgi:3-hydroxybutyryl-CoA dehydrogenase
MVGTHYFMPAHLVPAVEVVRSKHTDEAVADRVADILRETGKVPVRVNLDIPGFLANRMQHALSREALDLVERGIATAEDVDNAVRYGFGFRCSSATTPGSMCTAPPARRSIRTSATILRRVRP